MNKPTEFLENSRNRIDQQLLLVLSNQKQISKQLHTAMHYVVMNGGKRLRPALVYATGLAFGAEQAQLDRPAAAVELIHCYSLVHDDLPAMDNDDLRRGQPTCHIAFGEATAILVGDALQSLAFEILASTHFVDCKRQLQLIQLLAQQAGAKGMVGGQQLDMLAEGKAIDITELERLHQLKTGALIRASIQLGALAAGCTTSELNLLDRFATNLGLAFQIQDDILDIESNVELLGKQSGADVAHKKATYPALTNLASAKQKVIALHKSANNLLKQLNKNTTFLTGLSDFIIKRNY